MKKYGFGATASNEYLHRPQCEKMTFRAGGKKEKKGEKKHKTGEARYFVACRFLLTNFVSISSWHLRELLSVVSSRI